METQNGENKVHHLSMTIPRNEFPEFISRVLKPQLPCSLPLFRRCQYETTQTKRSTGELWTVTATDQTNSNLHPHNGVKAVDLALDKPWLAAYIDLEKAGQTQAWVFASWETTFSKRADPIVALQQSPECAVYQYLFFTLFRYLRTEKFPKLSQNPPEQWQRIKDEGKLVSLPFRRSKVLFGTLAECHWPFFDAYSSESERSVSREHKDYLKYILTSTTASLPATDPPHNLNFAPMEDKHLQTILDRSIIPRTIEALREIHVIGLFNNEATCVAWGMLSKDGSIGSLHTEPEYRRQGLAEAVCRRLLTDQIKIFADDLTTVSSDTPVYSHADVASDNIPSRKTMEKIGCKVHWRVAWIEVDLGELKKDSSTS